MDVVSLLISPESLLSRCGLHWGHENTYRWSLRIRARTETSSRWLKFLMVFSGAEGPITNNPVSPMEDPSHSSTAQLHICFGISLQKKKKKKGDSHGQTYLVGRLRHGPRKITGRQKAGVFSWCVLASTDGASTRHWLLHSRRLGSQTADSDRVIWDAYSAAAPKWLHSYRTLLVSFYPAPNFLWDPACKGQSYSVASTQCIHGEIIILVCLSVCLIYL